jgi:hypothetical protein
VPREQINLGKKKSAKVFLKETKHKSEVAIFRKYVLGGSRQNERWILK